MKTQKSYSTEQEYEFKHNYILVYGQCVDSFRTKKAAENFAGREGIRYYSIYTRKQFNKMGIKVICL